MSGFSVSPALLRALARIRSSRRECFKLGLLSLARIAPKYNDARPNTTLRSLPLQIPISQSVFFFFFFFFFFPFSPRGAAKTEQISTSALLKPQLRIGATPYLDLAIVRPGPAAPLAWLISSLSAPQRTQALLADIGKWCAPTRARLLLRSLRPGASLLLAARLACPPKGALTPRSRNPKLTYICMHSIYIYTFLAIALVYRARAIYIYSYNDKQVCINIALYHY